MIAQSHRIAFYFNVLIGQIYGTGVYIEVNAVISFDSTCWLSCIHSKWELSQRSFAQSVIGDIDDVVCDINISWEFTVLSLILSYCGECLVFLWTAERIDTISYLVQVVIMSVWYIGLYILKLGISWISIIIERAGSEDIIVDGEIMIVFDNIENSSGIVIRTAYSESSLIFVIKSMLDIVIHDSMLIRLGIVNYSLIKLEHWIEISVVAAFTGSCESSVLETVHIAVSRAWECMTA